MIEQHITRVEVGGARWGPLPPLLLLPLLSLMMTKQYFK